MKTQPAMHPIAICYGLLLLCCGGTELTDNGETGQPKEADVVVMLDPDAQGEPFGDLFRAVNLDAGKQMTDEEDYTRLQQLMCPASTNCTPGAIRFWDKVNFGRFALESPLTHSSTLQALHERGFPVYWSMVGTPAFLRDTCTGCVVEDNGQKYHLLRELDAPATDPKNPLNTDISCQCQGESWSSGPPSPEPVAGVSWLDYVSSTVTDLLDLFDPNEPNLRIGLWNEPDQLWWEGQQTGFVSMWCATATHIRELLVENNKVLLGGPDVSSWTHPIGSETTPLLEAIQTSCGEEAPYDFLTYHQYSEPGKLIFEHSVESIREWGHHSTLGVDVGEYASSLGHGAESTSPCDPSAIATDPNLHPSPTGTDPSAILCDHRGAVEDVALAASMAAQDHTRVYRFEVWDWGTKDMIDSRMGLLTPNHLPKPAATAFWMLSHLQGNRLAVVNQLDGAHPYHLLASHEADNLVVVIAAQNRTVSQQFVRGLLSQGLRYSEDVAPILAECPSFQSEDPETYLSELAQSEASADQLMNDCTSIDRELAESMAAALAYAAPRVGEVDEPFDLSLHIPGWGGHATLYRVDAYRNTFAESHRQWPNQEFARDSFDFRAAEEHLWEYMRTPVEQLDLADNSLTFQVLPDSLTMIHLSEK